MAGLAARDPPGGGPAPRLDGGHHRRRRGADHLADHPPLAGGGRGLLPAAVVRARADPQHRGVVRARARGLRDGRRDLVPPRGADGRLLQGQGGLHPAHDLRRVPADPHPGAAHPVALRDRRAAEGRVPGPGLHDLPRAALRGRGGRGGRHVPEDRLHAGRHQGAGGQPRALAHLLARHLAGHAHGLRRRLELHPPGRDGGHGPRARRHHPQLAAARPAGAHLPGARVHRAGRLPDRPALGRASGGGSSPTGRPSDEHAAPGHRVQGRHQDLQPRRRRAQFTALKDVSFRIDDIPDYGEFIAHRRPLGLRQVHHPQPHPRLLRRVPADHRRGPRPRAQGRAAPGATAA